MPAFQGFGSVSLSFAAAYALLVLLPGPNVLIVVQASVSPRPRAGLMAAAGIASGACALALISMCFAQRLGAIPLVAQVGHVGFALLLLMLGLRMLRTEEGTIAPPRPRAAGFFLAGFATASTNPFSAAFFGSYLAMSQAGGADALPLSHAIVTVFLVAASWFGSLAFALSAPPIRSLYARQRHRFEALVGLALLAAGASTMLRLVLQG